MAQFFLGRPVRLFRRVHHQGDVTMAILRKLKRILTEEFPAPDKVRLFDHDGVIGSISSERFKQMDPMDRHDLIHKILTAHLDPKEMRKTQVVVGVTHEEYDLMTV